MIGTFSALRPPVIVMGMHRSGTSVLAQLLREAGVFMGADRNRHEESELFLELNEEIFAEAGTTWDYPEPVGAFLDISPQHAHMTEVIRSDWSKDSGKYWGPQRGGVETPWGWKDPRNTFTLPLWLELFPDARVVHLVRHGVDVALSLSRREGKRKDKPQRKTFSERCLSLAGGFELWEEYVEAGLQRMNELPPERGLQIRFEDLLIRPLDTIQELEKFLGLSPAPESVKASVAKLRPEAACAFLNDPDGRALFEDRRGHPLMKQLGYDQPHSTGRP